MAHKRADRRRAKRFVLGLPVRARIAERAEPLFVELMDASASGSRFQVQGNVDSLHVDQDVAFGFVVDGWPNCQAKGRVVRVEHTGQFALALDDTNEAFDGFLRLLAARE
jgi:PilZ domain